MQKAQNIHRNSKKKCWNSKATWSEENEIAYNSQVFSFAFDCDVSPIDGYKKAHFLIFNNLSLTEVKYGFLLILVQLFFLLLLG